jgi:hypothetical protein
MTPRKDSMHSKRFVLALPTDAVNDYMGCSLVVVVDFLSLPLTVIET